MTTPPDDQWPARDDDTVVSRETVEPTGPPPGPPPDPEGRRIGYGMLLAILALALIAAAGVAAWLLTRDDNKKQTTTVVVTTTPTTNAAAKVAVPRLVGMKEQQALVRLGQVGLRPKEVFKPTKQPK